MSFFFAAQSHLLEEVAKFRAARRLWSRLVLARLSPRDPRSAALRFHTQTAGVSLTAQQPMNNVVRVTVQALAAALGGTQSLHTNAMDEALGLPTREAAVLALRTQQILAEETGVTDTVDPLAGSFAVESLTNEIERGAMALIERIDAMGGAVDAIESGWFGAQIAESAYAWQRDVESGARHVVGVNTYVEGESLPAEVLAIEPGLEARRAAEIHAFRERRDADAAAASLAVLRTAAAGSTNLVTPILGAVRSHATLGEICDTLRGVFGEHQSSGTV
jgi:methylmalonyl-CoA mutase N-terminal domain/subunit